MTEDLLLLKQRMQETEPSLFLGAGFSFGAINYHGRSLPLGSKLVDILFKYFYIDNPPVGKDKEYLTQVEECKDNLKEICTILRSEGRLNERNQLLTKLYSGCKPNPDSPYQDLITKYSWKRIFTLNIDDLVENIYSKKEINVWNNSSKGSINRLSDCPLLIKLHGDVNDNSSGYVFDNDEYVKFTAEGNCLLHEFADAYTDGDIIFLGTEYQENDVKNILEKYNNLGYEKDAHHYFFVSPKIRNIPLKNDIDKSKHLHWIEMDTEQFLTFIISEVDKNNNERRPLRLSGTVFLDEVLSDIPDPYRSDLYIGQEPQLDDFFENWDIRYPGGSHISKELKNIHRNCIVAVHGKAYVGKTCVANRLLVNLMTEGYLTFQLTKCNDSIIRILENYLIKCPLGSKIAFQIDNASYYFESILKLLENTLFKKYSIIAILVDTDINYYRKSYVLKRSSHLKVIPLNVTEELSKGYTDNIYSKLDEKGRLGEYNKFLGVPPDYKNISKIRIKMRELNDIVEVLYFAEEGRGFQDHFKSLINNIVDSEYYCLLPVMVMLSRLGINTIPVRIFSILFPERLSNFNVNNMVNDLDAVVKIKNGVVTMRCIRILQNTMSEHLSEKQTKYLLESIIKHTLGQFSESSRNEYNELF